MDELRKGFHQQLDDARNELAQLAAMVIERISRATAILLDGDLEDARKPSDRRIDLGGAARAIHPSDAVAAFLRSRHHWRPCI